MSQYFGNFGISLLSTGYKLPTAGRPPVIPATQPTVINVPVVTSVATANFKYRSGLEADDVVDDVTTEALYAQIDQLGSAQDENKPMVNIKGPQNAIDIVGRAPSWLWWVGAGPVAAVGAYTFKQVAFGPGRRS
jgi:hypothetical protein